MACSVILIGYVGYIVISGVMVYMLVSAQRDLE